jgi:hypothetical protein
MSQSSEIPPPARLPGLSELAPEVASTVVRVAGDIALVIGDDGLIRSVAEGNLPLHSEQRHLGRPALGRHRQCPHPQQGGAAARGGAAPRGVAAA